MPVSCTLCFSIHGKQENTRVYSHLLWDYFDITQTDSSVKGVISRKCKLDEFSRQPPIVGGISNRGLIEVALAVPHGAAILG